VRYGVFSDVHGNYEALKAVLSFYRKNGVENFICCGDIVGYGPQPLECTEEIMGLRSLVAVVGNHDAAAVGRMELRWFNANACWAIDFARKKLTGKAMDFLVRLPERVETDFFTMVHGSPRKPLREYMLSGVQFADNESSWTVSPCFIGHSHMPLYFRYGEKGLPETDFLRPLVRISAASGRMMLNPGSVGQPRDGDPRAACAIYDSDKMTFELYRVFYNVEATQNLMAELKMPPLLSERLSFGF